MGAGTGVISVKNKLEVKLGGFIQIPGCEPVSSLTSLGLLADYRRQCKHSQIPVKIALKLIPGSRLINVTTPTGYSATGWFLELPSGPPPDGEDCPKDCKSGPDWYQMLKKFEEIPRPINNECAGFDYNVCGEDIDPFKVPCKDPKKCPSAKPAIGNNNIYSPAKPGVYLETDSFDVKMEEDGSKPLPHLPM